MLLVRLIVSLLIFLVTILAIFCGISFYIVPYELDLIHIGSHTFTKPAPLEALKVLIDKGFSAFTNETIWNCLIVTALCSVVGLFLFLVSIRVFRLLSNKKTTLHGSAEWATKKELRKAGLLKPYGMVLGQTYDAIYKTEKVPKPKKRKNETKSDYKFRLSKWDPRETQEVFKSPGELITQNKNNHLLLVGSTRSGKGVSVLIPTTFQWPESMIIFDPKGESWNVSANFRSRFSYTMKFEPERPDESMHYNPLLAIRRGKNAISDIQNLGFILIPDNPRATDSFWDTESRRLFTAVCGYVVYCEPPERKTFAQISSIFSDYKQLEDEDDEDDGLLLVKRYLNHYVKKLQKYVRDGRCPENIRKEWDEYYKEKDEVDRLERSYVNSTIPASVLKRKDKLAKTKSMLDEKSKKFLTDEDIGALRTIERELTYFAGCEDKQLSSTLSTMTSHLTVLSDPNVQAITDRSDFTMEDFVYGIKDEKGNKHPVSLYLCVSLASIKRLMPIMKIFYEQAITLLTRELDSSRPYRLLLIMDEFYQMGKLDIIKNALTLAAGYGILCLVAIQSYKQLEEVYGNESVFLDNFAYQVVLRVNDESTCAKIERTLGQGTKQHKTTSFSGNMNVLVHSGENINVQELGRSLMTAEEVRTMPDSDCLIISSGAHPYKAKKIRYFMDERFTRLYQDKKGHMLPPPAVNENYPHPEAIHDGINEGVDNYGWHYLKGAAESYVSLTEEDDEDENILTKEKDDYITDTSEKRKQSSEQTVKTDEEYDYDAEELLSNFLNEGDDDDVE